jgi:hypothetical protein
MRGTWGTWKPHKHIGFRGFRLDPAWLPPIGSPHNEWAGPG